MFSFSKWKISAVFLVCIVLGVFALPNFTSIGSLPYFPTKQVSYGLDLKGGSQLLLRVDFKYYIKEQLSLTLDAIRKNLRKSGIAYQNLRSDESRITFTLKNIDDKEKAQKEIKKSNQDLDIKLTENGEFIISYSEDKLEKLQESIIEQTREIVRHRVDETGTLEPSITRHGNLGILLQVPGLQDPEQLKRLLGKTAQLTFHFIETEYHENIIEARALPTDTKMLKGESGGWYVVNKKPVLSGNLLTDAELSTANDGQPAVAFKLNALGAKIFSEITKNNTGKRLGIVLDDKVINSPVIQDHIMNGNGIISGNFDVNSANELALLLRAGSLPAPILIMEEKTVGPSLGEDSIRLGKKSAAIGTIVVIVFMIAVYGIYGAFASVALLVNIIFIIAIMTILQLTLTMPGIAGIVLTMGMAVDANVLIFERIREEAKLKSTMAYAISRGFDQAFATIFDSNLTTLIAAFFLYAFGSGIIKGFAVTLTIGILSSMFTAITLTKLLIFTWLKLKRA